MKNLKTPRGTRDFLPEEKILRNRIMETIKNVFEKYGFDPLETPVFENLEILTTKGGGGEAIKNEIYHFKDKSDRELGLRFDLTVPMARVVAGLKNISLPFKRYCIDKVWRYDRPQKGRYREFYQCDVDIVGVKSELADAECIACICEALNNLGFEDFIITINDRILLSDLMKYAKVKQKDIVPVFRIIDKLDKIGKKDVEKELKKLGLSEICIKKVMKFIDIGGEPRDILKEVKKLVPRSKGIKNLEQVFKYLKYFNIKAQYVINLSLVRGLEYYTGPIYEIICPDAGIGSIAGGGRYDKLIGVYSKKSLPATGISIGIERVIDIIKSLKIMEPKKSVTNVFVAPVSGMEVENAVGIAQILRDKGIQTQMDLMGKSLGKQLKYAANKEISVAVIVGENDLRIGKVTVRNLLTGKEEKVKITHIANYVDDIIIQ